MGADGKKSMSASELMNSGVVKKGVEKSSASLDYAPGDKVKHIKFGVGEVISIVDGGRDYEVTVQFEGYGIKKLFAQFAKLKKV